MRASKELWEKNARLHCALHFVWAAMALFGDIVIIRNGGFGKMDAPTVRPDNRPFLYWSGVVVIALAGLVVLGFGIWRLVKIKRGRLKLQSRY